MISEPMVMVECDSCGHEQSYGMTSLVRKSWDLRYLEKQLESDGWRLEDGLYGKVTCPSCIEDEEEDEEVVAD